MITMIDNDNNNNDEDEKIVHSLIARDQWSSIYHILLSNCYSVAMDRNGSMVLRLCYDLVDLDRKAQIADDIINHARELAVDPVGNYVVQHVLCIPKE